MGIELRRNDWYLVVSCREEFICSVHNVAHKIGMRQSSARCVAPVLSGSNMRLLDREPRDRNSPLSCPFYLAGRTCVCRDNCPIFRSRSGPCGRIGAQGRSNASRCSSSASGSCSHIGGADPKLRRTRGRTCGERVATDLKARILCITCGPLYSIAALCLLQQDKAKDNLLFLLLLLAYGVWLTVGFFTRGWRLVIY